MSRYEGAERVGPREAGLLALPRLANVKYGASAVCIRRPAGMTGALILRGEVGGPWKIGMGDQVARSFTAQSATDVLVAVSHGYQSPVDGPFALSSTGTLPGGLSAGSTYYTRAVDAHSLRMYATEQEALNSAATSIDITTPGTSAHYIQGKVTIGAAGADVTNGIYAFPVTLAEGWVRISAPARVTIIGTGATDALVYGWT